MKTKLGSCPRLLNHSLEAIKTRTSVVDDFKTHLGAQHVSKLYSCLVGGFIECLLPV